MTDLEQTASAIAATYARDAGTRAELEGEIATALRRERERCAAIARRKGLAFQQQRHWRASDVALDILHEIELDA